MGSCRFGIGSFPNQIGSGLGRLEIMSDRLRIGSGRLGGRSALRWDSFRFGSVRQRALIRIWAIEDLIGWESSQLEIELDQL